METKTTATAKPAAKIEVKQPTMFESLLAIQTGGKTINKNKKGYSGTYADIEQVWEAIRQLINGNGFVIFHQSTATGVNTTALHIGGEKIESFIPFIQWDKRENEKGKVSFRDPQEQGKEITYARRYNIGAIFNLVIDDEDNDANRKNNYQKDDNDGTLAAGKLRAAKTWNDAASIYNSLSKSERLTQEVINALAEEKAKFGK